MNNERLCACGTLQSAPLKESVKDMENGARRAKFEKTFVYQEDASACMCVCMCRCLLLEYPSANPLYRVYYTRRYGFGKPDFRIFAGDVLLLGPYRYGYIVCASAPRKPPDGC